MGAKEDAVRKIGRQQEALKKESGAWYVGEQLKEICRREERSAALIAQDLDNREMGLAQAEKQLRAWADKHKDGSVAVVTPERAEKILRRFYGLPERETAAAESGILDLADFL